MVKCKPYRVRLKRTVEQELVLFVDAPDEEAAGERAVWLADGATEYEIVDPTVVPKVDAVVECD